MGRPKEYAVHLSPEERNHLIELLVGGINKVRVTKRGQVLLKADEGWTDQQIAEALSVGRATVGRIRQHPSFDRIDFHSIAVLVALLK